MTNASNISLRESLEASKKVNMASINDLECKIKETERAMRSLNSYQRDLKIKKSRLAEIENSIEYCEKYDELKRIKLTIPAGLMQEWKNYISTIPGMTISGCFREMVINRLKEAAVQNYGTVVEQERAAS